jgi:hypothetical protein
MDLLSCILQPTTEFKIIWEWSCSTKKIIQLTHFAENLIAFMHFNINSQCIESNVLYISALNIATCLNCLLTADIYYFLDITKTFEYMPPF